MHQDGYISKTALSVMGMWAVVLILLGSAWAVTVFISHHWVIGGMLAASACTLAGFTSTVHNRLYVARVCGVIRATSGLDAMDTPHVRSIR